ncbi:MAG TPA: M12 family metallo-peptidase [Thermoanaerobaculia bacterium]|nr:M12 family metallo-peptidase [Thermoanaerobaculia bacterium]
MNTKNLALKIAPAIVCLVLSLSAFAEARNPLFCEVRADVAATLQPAALSIDLNTVRRRYLTLNADALASGMPVTQNLFDDASVTVDGSKFHQLGDGTWQLGEVLPSETWSQVTMGISGTAVSGTVQLGRRVYEVRSVAQDVVVIEEIDMTQAIAPDTPPDAHPALDRPEEPAPARGDGRFRLAPLSWNLGPLAVPNITVLAVNSPLLCAMPGAAASQAANFQSNLNLAFSFNLQPIATSTVISVCVNRWPGTDLNAELNWLKADATVANLRNQYHADIVTFIVPSGQPVTGGLMVGLAPTVNTSLNKADAFNVVVGSYATSSYTLAHEIGHNLGMRHDRITDNRWTDTACNYGYCRANGPRDIMAYDSACAGSFQAGVYSTPLTQNYLGFVMGPYGVSCSAPPFPFTSTYTRANNLQTLTNNVATAAAWY